MDNHVLLNNHIDNHFEFDLTVEGLKMDDIVVRFVIHAEPFNMVFLCEHLKGSMWFVDLPKMQYLEATTYSFVVEAIIDGYYFKAHSGALTVTKSPEVYVKTSESEMKVEGKTIPEEKKKPETKITLTPSIGPAANPVDPTPVTEVTQDEPKPSEVVGSERIKEIIDRIKDDKNSRDVVLDKEDVVEEDPLADAKKVADDVLTETEVEEIKEEVTPPKKTPRKKAKKKTPTKKVTTEEERAKLDDKVKQLLEEVKAEKILDDDTSSSDKLDELIEDVKSEKDAKKLASKAEAARRVLQEMKEEREAIAKEAADKEAAEKEVLLEAERKEKEEIAEKEAAARAVLESVQKKPTSKTRKKNVRRGKKVVK